jgi:hypothetical protein
VFGAKPVPVAVPCPRCLKQPTIVVFRHYDTLTLFCRACENAWTVDVSEHPELTTIRAEHDPQP